MINVKPETFLGWHRKGFQLLWRWKSRPRGRPRLREEVQKLIQRMARENPTWGEERIAAELLLKLHIRVSPRTVRRYMDAQSCRFVLHDRDRIYSSELDSALKAMDLKVLKTPFQAPQANAFCERLIGTVRRECLDFMIPLNERHLRSLLKEWVTHYNRGRPHASLGPGIPNLRSGQQQARLCGHRIPIDHQVVAKAILGGLHHEYSLERRAA